MIITKLENDEFRFIGIDVEKDGENIVISMDKYAKC